MVGIQGFYFLADTLSMQANPIPLSEILISARQVTQSLSGDTYEFILDESLRVIECVRIAPKHSPIAQPIKNIWEALDGLLFELKHVRVDPNVDNQNIIQCLTRALNEIDVNVLHPPKPDSMAMCYKPLGEISDNVRFYLSGKGTLVFLSPATRPKLIASN